MSPVTPMPVPVPTREEQTEAILAQLGQAVRKMVERAVDVPEAQEFGAIDTEFAVPVWVSPTRSGKPLW
ncbi:MAG TPA: hypothetical protein VGE74_12820 [Gemmata sp.]